LRPHRPRIFRAFRPSILEPERLKMLDASQAALSAFDPLVALAARSSAINSMSPPFTVGRVDPAVESMLSVTAGRSRPSSAAKAFGFLAKSLGAGLRLGKNLSAAPDGLPLNPLAVHARDRVVRGQVLPLEPTNVLELPVAVGVAAHRLGFPGLAGDVAVLLEELLDHRHADRRARRSAHSTGRPSGPPDASGRPPCDPGVPGGSSPPAAGWSLCTASGRPSFTDPPLKAVGESIQVVPAPADRAARDPGGTRCRRIPIDSAGSARSKLRAHGRARRQPARPGIRRTDRRDDRGQRQRPGRGLPCRLRVRARSRGAGRPPRRRDGFPRIRGRQGFRRRRPGRHPRIAPNGQKFAMPGLNVADLTRPGLASNRRPAADPGLVTVTASRLAPRSPTAIDGDGSPDTSPSRMPANRPSGIPRRGGVSRLARLGPDRPTRPVDGRRQRGGLLLALGLRDAATTGRCARPGSNTAHRGCRRESLFPACGCHDPVAGQVATVVDIRKEADAFAS